MGSDDGTCSLQDKKRRRRWRPPVKAPRYPGMAAFDSNLDELPVQKRPKGQESPDTSVKFFPDLVVTPGTPASSPGRFLKLFHYKPRPHEPLKPRYVLHDVRSFTDPLEAEALFFMYQGRRDARFEYKISIDATKKEYVTGVKRVYRDINDLEKQISQETAHLSQRRDFHRASKKIEYLDSLHRSLLQEHHRFMLFINQPNAPPGLRKLVAKYSMPERMWENNIFAYLETIRQNTDSAETIMIPFINQVYHTLNSLHMNAPLMKDSWDMIARNLHNYLESLHEHGIAIPDHHLQYWPSRRPPDIGIPFDDLSQEERIAEMKAWEDPMNFSSPIPVEEPAQIDFTEVEPEVPLPLKEPALQFMAGWLTFGSRLATSLCAYCKTFKYLAWVGATF